MAIIVNWLLETWRAWLTFTIFVLAGWTLYWYLFEQRTYRAMDRKAQVKHGRLGHWIDLEEHLKDHETTK